MTNQDHVTIKHLERNIIGSRYLLEVYKIANRINSQAIANNKELAALLANTHLRSLILTLCAIFNLADGNSTTKNLSLVKSFKKIFITSNDMRPDLSDLIFESIDIMKKQKLYKLRNKKIAHLDLEEITPSLTSSDPNVYEKLVSNAETIISAIIKESGLQPERDPPNPETDPALQQLEKLLTPLSDNKLE
jgi:hypothetical protein